VQTVEGQPEIKPAGTFILEPGGLVHQWGNPSTSPLTFITFNINLEGTTPTSPAGRRQHSRQEVRPSRRGSATCSGQEIGLFAIDWLKRGILVERETSVLQSPSEAIAAAKLRAHDVARRHPGQEPDTFRVMDPTGKILGVFPKKLQ
jgi:hypothetical protein